MLNPNGNVTMAEDLGDTDEEPPLIRETLQAFSRFLHRSEITDQHVSVRQLAGTWSWEIHGTMIYPHESRSDC